MLFEEYPELTAKQYLDLEVGDTIIYISYVLGDYELCEGEIKNLMIKGNAISDNYYEYAYDNKAILTNGKAVTYCDITQVIKKRK